MSKEAPVYSSNLQRLEQRARGAGNWLLDLVFPPVCGICGRVDFRLCDGCALALSDLPIEIEGRQVDNLDAVCATGRHQGLLQNAVQAFKYDGVTELGGTLAARLVTGLHGQSWAIDLILPVPLFPNRQAERGYNQSYLLSQPLSRASGILCRTDCLARIRDTEQQAQLSGAERALNVRDAFVASEDVSGLSLLLVDDVVTTGSTLSQCAATLRQKSAKAVYAITVSHS